MYKTLVSILLVMTLSGCTSGESLVEEIDTTTQPTVASTPQSALDRHNAIRAEVFRGATMNWDETLALSAQEYANYLASSGKFEHDNSQYGENLFVSSQNAGFVDAINNWYKEKAYYNYADNSCVGVCGHYTQMIWRDSTQLGCAKATYTTGSYKGWSVIVCRYNPAGNYTGERPY
jgi:pathogenesis-related protein 1